MELILVNVWIRENQVSARGPAFGYPRSRRWGDGLHYLADTSHHPRETHGQLKRRYTRSATRSVHMTFVTNNFQTFYLTNIWDPFNVLSLRVKVNLGVMATKECTPELEPHHQMLFTVRPRSPHSGGGGLTSLHEVQSVYSKPRRQVSHIVEMACCRVWSWIIYNNIRSLLGNVRIFKKKNGIFWFRKKFTFC